MDKWRTRKLIRFSDLCSVNAWRTGCPYSGDVVFGIVQWIVRESTRMHRGVRLYPDAINEIRGTSSLSRSDDSLIFVSPVKWRSTLQEMFARLILKTERGRVLSYLTMKGMSWPGAANLTLRYRVITSGACRGLPDNSHDRRIDELGDYIGRDLKVSYNRSHPDAVTICDVQIVVADVAYALLVRYGYREDRGRSFWDVPDNGLAGDERPYGGLAVTARRGEAFGEFIDRAHGVMRELVTPSTEVPWSVYSVSVSVLTGFACAYVLAPTPETAEDYCRGVMGANIVSLGADRRVCLLPREALSLRSAVVIYQGDSKPDAEIIVDRADNGIVETLKRLSGAPARVAATG